MNLPMSEYLSLKAFSAGLAQRVLSDSPFHAWYGSPWNPDYRPRTVNVANIGTCAHTVLLEGSEAALAVIDPAEYPSKPTKANPEGNIPKGWTNDAIKEARDNALASGKTPILATDMADIRAMVETARQYLAASELAGIFDSGEPELTFTWTENGVPCKIRPDWLNIDKGICLSYKTTPSSANPRDWIRRQLPGYEVGMPLYERGCKAIAGTAKVVHLVQQQERPYACSLVALAPSRQTFAERELDMALAIWKKCLDDRKFPAYPLRICYAESVAYAEASFEEQFAQDEIDNLELDK